MGPMTNTTVCPRTFYYHNVLDVWSRPWDPNFILLCVCVCAFLVPVCVGGSGGPCLTITLPQGDTGMWGAAVCAGLPLEGDQCCDWLIDLHSCSFINCLRSLRRRLYFLSQGVVSVTSHSFCYFLWFYLHFQILGLSSPSVCSLTSQGENVNKCHMVWGRDLTWNGRETIWR